MTPAPAGPATDRQDGLYRPQQQGRDETHDQPRCGVAEQPRHCVDALRLDETPGAAANPWPARREAVRVEPSWRASQPAPRADETISAASHTTSTPPSAPRRTQMTGRRHGDTAAPAPPPGPAVRPGGRGQARHQGQDDRQWRRSSAATCAEHQPEQAAGREQHGQHQALNQVPRRRWAPPGTSRARSSPRPRGSGGPAERYQGRAAAAAAVAPRSTRSPSRASTAGRTVVEPGEPGGPPQQQGKERGGDPPGAEAPGRAAARLQQGAGAVVGWTWSAVRSSARVIGGGWVMGAGYASGHR